MSLYFEGEPCANIASENCKNEYQNAINNGNLQSFYDRCNGDQSFYDQCSHCCNNEKITESQEGSFLLNMVECLFSCYISKMNFIPNNSFMFIVLGCIEESNWYTVVGNYKCLDYSRNKWCEDGEVGSAWNPTWQWNLGNNGEDARTMCCECGGGQKGNIKTIQL